LGVDQDRQSTARARKARIISSLNEHLGDPNSRELIQLGEALGHDGVIVAGSDIDGLVSAMMLAAVSRWRIGALVVKSGSVLIEPGYEDFATVLRGGNVFGVDVFSPLFPTVSNHPLLFGTRVQGPQWLRDEFQRFDDFVVERCRELGSFNLSTWAGIKATSPTNSPDGFDYKYPLGTAQVVLAVLELLRRAPRFYDRQYLPWLVANCDGGLDSIRDYPWNVPGWWSALAAVVGPASHSESLYRLANDQRPTEFIDIDRHLRYDERDRSRSLTTKWNLASAEDPSVIASAVSLVRDWSGWPDPFIGGVEKLGAWRELTLTRNLLGFSGIAKRATTHDGEREIRAHIAAAAESLHMNFSRFRERGIQLGWMLPDRRPDVERLLGQAPPLPIAEAPAPYDNAHAEATLLEPD
jgi:hypothetical protein